MANSMKEQIGYTLVLLLFFLLGLVTVTTAQQDPAMTLTPEEQAKKMTDHQTTQLQLNELQVTEVYALNLELVGEIHKAKAGGRSIKTMKAMQKIHRQHNEKMEQILSADQFEQLKEMQAERRKRRKEQRKRNDTTPPEGASKP